MLIQTETEESRLSKLSQQERADEATKAFNDTQAVEEAETAATGVYASAVEANVLASIALYNTTAFDHILTAHGIEKEGTIEPSLDEISLLVEQLRPANPTLSESINHSVLSDWDNVTL